MPFILGELRDNTVGFKRNYLGDLVLFLKKYEVYQVKEGSRMEGTLIFETLKPVE